MNFITDDIKKVVEAMRPLDVSYGQPMVDYLNEFCKAEFASEMPFYIPGHRLEIVNRLLEKDKDPVFKYQKYPLIALRLDTIEDPHSGMNHYNLNIAILTYTDQNWNYEQRLERIFKPVLAPIYDRFIIELVNADLFTWEGDQRKPPHRPVLRPYWGTAQRNAEGNEKHIFSDPIDAIEILNLEINAPNRC